MSSCEDGLVICHYVGRRASLTQQSTYGNYGDDHCWSNAKLTSEQTWEENLTISLKCEPIDSYIAHIVQVRYAGFSSYAWRTNGTYSQCPELSYEYSDSQRSEREIGEFLILHTTEDVTPILLPPMNVPIQRLAFTGTLSRNTFLPMLGNIDGIKAWVAANQLTVSDSGEKDSIFFFGTESYEYSSFSGWEIDCIIPKPALDKYPFCGGVVAGEEEKGPQFINLCQNDLGVCAVDCCDCCSIAEKLLAKLKNHPLYTTTP